MKAWSEDLLVSFLSTGLALIGYYGLHKSSFVLQRCHRCGVIPNDPCLCLICGEYLCYKSMCQKTEEEEKAEELIKPFLIRTFGRQQFAACRHARRCGAGTSILLQVNTSYIVIIRGTRCCLWGKNFGFDFLCCYLQTRSVSVGNVCLVVLVRTWTTNCFYFKQCAV